MSDWYLEFIADTGERFVIGDEARFTLVRSMAKRAAPKEKVLFRAPPDAPKIQLEELKKLGAKQLRAE